MNRRSEPAQQDFDTLYATPIRPKPRMRVVDGKYVPVDQPRAVERQR